MRLQKNWLSNKKASISKSKLTSKALGVAERGWNAERGEQFETAFDRFYSIIVAREMPVWKEKGYTFKKRLLPKNALHSFTFASGTPHFEL